MTAILEQIRQLEAARNRGEMTSAQFERAKERLFDTVEDAVATPIAPSAPPRRGPPSIFWPALGVSVLGIAVVTGLATLLIGDLTLALTLAVTLLAAVTVAAFRALDE